jgi:hypothetical protein
MIDNPYGLSKHLRVEKVLKFNLTKRLSERSDFTNPINN